MTDADVLIVGGGIAGLSAAWFAARRGRSVTLVDDGSHRASDLPVALINPLRGHRGRLVARGVDGMHATFALIDALRADGHPIETARGMYRPLVDRDDAARVEATWRTAVGGRLAFDWDARAPAALGLVDPVPTLFLHGAGWVAPVGLLTALRRSVSTICVGRITRIDAIDGATLADGTTIRARTMLWCGGAWGCATLGGDATVGSRHASDDAVFKPGSLLESAERITADALSFGVYAVPRSDGTTIVGPTREDACATFPVDAVPDAAVRHLEDRVARTFGSKIALRPAWRGVRLARLSTAAAQALHGVPTLTALGSRGFLMAPLLAAEWARSL